MSFRVGVTRDFVNPDGSLSCGDIGLGTFDGVSGLEWEFLPENHTVLPRTVADDYDAILLLGPRAAAESVEGARRLKILARFGVGYDNVDIPACSRNGVLVSITPDGVRRPVAASMVLYILALSHRMIDKDRLIRAGRWNDRLSYMGVGLVGRTVGLIGFGNIGRELCRLLRPFEPNIIAADPVADPEAAARLGVELVDLDELLARSDFVCVCCSLSAATHHLIGEPQLSIMKPTAFLVNVARGPIVDQAALTETLRERKIAGAALDVFEVEPIDPSDPLLAMDNVILAPHAICWTDQCFEGNGLSACRSILDVMSRRAPTHLVDQAALLHPRLGAWFTT